MFFPLPGGGCVFSGMLLSGGTRHQPIQLRVSTRPPFRPHSLIKPDTRPAAASALPVKLSCVETSELYFTISRHALHLLILKPPVYLNYNSWCELNWGK